MTDPNYQKQPASNPNYNHVPQQNYQYDQNNYQQNNYNQNQYPNPPYGQQPPPVYTAPPNNLNQQPNYNNQPDYNNYAQQHATYNQDANVNDNLIGKPGPSEFHNQLEFHDDLDVQLPEFKRGCQDVIFAVFFVLHLAGMVYLSYFYSENIDINDPSKNNWTDIYFGIGIITAAICFALGWMKFIQSGHAASVIKWALIAQICMWGIWAVLSLLAGNIIGGIVCGVICAISAFYYWAVQRRIPFATACIEIAVTIVNEYPAVIYLALLALVAQSLWMVCWSIAFYGYSNGQDEMEGAVVFALFVSLYWTLEVVKYTVHCTIAGVTAAWYYTPNSANPTWGALKRSLTSSFGSICLGALLISIILAMKAMLQQARNRRRDGDRNIGEVICMCLVMCMLNCLERMAEIFNEFGFAYVAIHGFSYCQSCNMVLDLFKSKGWTMLINEDLIRMALMAGALMSGLIIGAASAAIGYFVVDNDHYAAYGIMGFIMGFFLCWVVLQVLISAVTTIFVVWVDDPQVMDQTRPAASAKLSGTALGYRNGDYGDVGSV